MKIIVDMMGGDNAPLAVLEGAEVKKWEHTGLPYGNKNPLPFPFSKRSPVSDLRQTNKQKCFSFKAL